MATVNTTITTAEGWVLVASTKCTVQVVSGASGGFSNALYHRAESAPASTSTDGLADWKSVTNNYSTPQNSYVRATENAIVVCVITE